MKFHTLIVCRDDVRAVQLRRALAEPTAKEPYGTGYYTIAAGGALVGYHFNTILFEPDWAVGHANNSHAVKLKLQEWAEHIAACRIVSRETSKVIYLG